MTLLVCDEIDIVRANIEHHVAQGVDLLIARRHNMLPSASEDDPFFERLVVRDQWSYNAMARPLIGKICHRPDRDVWIAQGNHELHSETLQLLEDVPPITIMHFPMRTYV